MVPILVGSLLLSLPLIEIPAVGNSAADRHELAIVLSGDGGWAALDRGVAAAFSKQGIPVVGFDSLRYFWHERSPDEAARDLAAVIDHYRALWNRDVVQLVGYSFGADVLPFLVNRLPAQMRQHIAGVTLVGASDSATFEIHLSDWLPGVTTQGQPLQPEIERLQPPPLCIHGEGESVGACAHLPASQRALIGSGHHLGGDGSGIVDRILRHSGVAAGACAAAEGCR